MSKLVTLYVGSVISLFHPIWANYLFFYSVTYLMKGYNHIQTTEQLRLMTCHTQNSVHLPQTMIRRTFCSRMVSRNKEPLTKINIFTLSNYTIRLYSFMTIQLVRLKASLTKTAE